MALWCFVGGYIDLYPRSCCCRLRELSPDASRFGSPGMCVRKDVDTFNTETFIVSWRSLGVRVAPNWFICTDAENDDTRIVFSTCGIMFKIFSLCLCV